MARALKEIVDVALVVMFDTLDWVACKLNLHPVIATDYSTGRRECLVCGKVWYEDK